MGPLLAAALPFAANVGLGLLGAAGQHNTNKANARMAREQMGFQERMSSTAAQRAVKDYLAAGLNPALAYERGASSPGGATATMGDTLGAGISNARSAMTQRAELAIRRQELANLQTTQGKLDAETRAANALAGKANTESDLNTQLFRFNEINQPIDRRYKTATALLQESLIPGAKNEADLQTKLGTWAPALGTAKTVTQILNSLLNRK